MPYQEPCNRRLRRRLGSFARAARAPCAVAALAALCVLQLAILKYLPYSSSWIIRCTPAETAGVPSGGKFAVGPVVWETDLYRATPSPGRSSKPG